MDWKNLPLRCQSPYFHLWQLFRNSITLLRKAWCLLQPESLRGCHGFELSSFLIWWKILDKWLRSLYLLVFFFFNHVIEELDGRVIIKLGNPGGGEQEHRRGGSHFCQESSYFSFVLTKFETPVKCFYMLLNMVMWCSKTEWSLGIIND